MTAAFASIERVYTRLLTIAPARSAGSLAVPTAVAIAWASVFRPWMPRWIPDNPAANVDDEVFKSAGSPVCCRHYR